MSGPTVNRCCMCGQDPCICPTKEERIAARMQQLESALAAERKRREEVEVLCDRYREAMEWFCSRVERGEVRSKRTYTKFKEILSGSKVAHEQEVPPNCIEIVRSYLMAHGFDGLYHEGDCGCELNDLCPCNNDFSDCTPGYKVPADDESDCDFYIVGENPAALQRGKEGGE